MDELNREDVSVPMKGHERDTLLLAMYDRVARIDARTQAIPDHEERIRKLEKRVWSVPGVSALVAVLAIFGIHPH